MFMARPSLPLVPLTIIFVTIGVLFGLIAGGSELANPFSSAAQFERDRVETKYLDQQRQIDTEYYAQSKQIELNNQIEQGRQVIALEAKRREQELTQIAHREQIVNSLLPIITGGLLAAALIVSSGTAYYLVCAGHKLRSTQQPQTRSIDWQDELQRDKVVRWAREAERQWRAAQHLVAEGNGNGHKLRRPTPVIGQN